MDLNCILNKAYTVVRETLINTADINANEIKTLENNGYNVKLYSYTWLQNPYYSIKKV